MRNGGSSLVGADTGSFESFGTQLFVYVGDHVYAEREVVNISLLTSNTTAETGLGVWLEVSELAGYPFNL